MNFASLHGSVTESLWRQKVSGASAILFDQGGQRIAETRVRDGEFAFFALDPGPYTVFLVQQGYGEVAREVQLGEGHWVKLPIVLNPAKPAVIKGRVLVNDKAVTGALLQGFSGKCRVWTESYGNGQYLLGPSYPGEWVIIADYAGQTKRFPPIKVGPGKIREVDIQLG